MAGPEKISIDNTMYDISLKLLNSSINILADNSFSLPESSSISQPLTKYEEMMVQIEGLVTLYKNLLKKQASCLQDVYNEMAIADSSYEGGADSLSSPSTPALKLPNIPNLPNSGAGSSANSSTSSTTNTTSSTAPLKPGVSASSENIPNPFPNLTPPLPTGVKVGK